MYFLKLSAIVNPTNHTVAVLREVVEKKEEEDSLPFFYKNIGCELIDIISLTEKIDIIVDDEGLFIQNNPAFEIRSKNGQFSPIQLVGTLLFGTNRLTDEGIETVGFSSVEELEKALQDIQYEWIGITRG